VLSCGRYRKGESGVGFVGMTMLDDSLCVLGVGKR